MQKKLVLCNGNKTYVNYPFFRYGKIHNYHISFRLILKKKKSINNINSTCNIFSYGWVDNLLSTPHMVEYNKLYYELDVSFRLIKKRKNNVQRITRKNNKRNTKLLL